MFLGTSSGGRIIQRCISMLLAVRVVEASGFLHYFNSGGMSGVLYCEKAF